jgi:hypothetical protein
MVFTVRPSCGHTTIVAVRSERTVHSQFERGVPACGAEEKYQWHPFLPTEMRTGSRTLLAPVEISHTEFMWDINLLFVHLGIGTTYIVLMVKPEIFELQLVHRADHFISVVIHSSSSALFQVDISDRENREDKEHTLKAHIAGCHAQTCAFAAPARSREPTMFRRMTIYKSKRQWGPKENTRRLKCGVKMLWCFI